jgi:hypothetical protein
MWRYHDLAGSSASPNLIPPKLRIDDIIVTSVPIGAENGDKTPESFQLSQNYPNPFNTQTSLPYDLPEPGHVTLTLYTIDGRRVARIEEGYRPPGRHTLSINMQGRASGVYIARLQVHSSDGISMYHGVQRLTLLK